MSVSEEPYRNDDDANENDDDDADDNIDEDELNDDNDENDTNVIIYDNDEPLAEGEIQKEEPKYIVVEDKTNSMTFYTLCTALEAVWNASTTTSSGSSSGSTTSSKSTTRNHQSHAKNRKWSDVQKLWKLLPPKFLQHLQQEEEETTLSSSHTSRNTTGKSTTTTTTTTTTTLPTRTVQSIFPLLRLLLPEKDGSRQFQMAESTIGIMYGNALGLSSSQSSKYQMLLHYTDPHYVTSTSSSSQQGLGDLSLVVQTVVATTKTTQPSTYTIGQINAALDVLASLPAQAKQYKSNHDWKKRTMYPPTTNKKLRQSPYSVKELRIQWLRQLNDGTFRSPTSSNNHNSNNNNHNDNKNINPGLSPLEHKWLVRILLRKMQYGLVRRFCFVGYMLGIYWPNPQMTRILLNVAFPGCCYGLYLPSFIHSFVSQ